MANTVNNNSTGLVRLLNCLPSSGRWYDQTENKEANVMGAILNRDGWIVRYTDVNGVPQRMPLKRFIERYNLADN